MNLPITDLRGPTPRKFILIDESKDMPPTSKETESKYWLSEYRRRLEHGPALAPKEQAKLVAIGEDLQAELAVIKDSLRLIAHLISE